MLQWTTALVAALVLLSSTRSPAQTKQGSGGSLLARLSYQSSSHAREPKIHEQRDTGRGATPYGSLRRIQVAQYCPDCPSICFSVYRSGYYRISKHTLTGQENLQGTLSNDQLVQVRKMLDTLDLTTSFEGGFVLKGTESVQQLVVEVVRDHRVVHRVWFDVDHQRPFPPSVVSLANWLQGFKPQGASRLTLRELSNQPICPQAHMKPVQPVAAALHGMLAASCERR